MTGMPGGKVDLDSGRVMIVTSKQRFWVRAAVIANPKLPEALFSERGSCQLRPKSAVGGRGWIVLTPNMATFRMVPVLLLDSIFPGFF